MDTTGPTAGAGIYTPLEDDLNAMEEEAVSSSPERWGVRCLTLKAGNDNTPLRCALFQSHLGQIGGKYEALSYTWGDSSVKSSMLLNGQAFEITRNLEAALRHLRRPNSERVLWIDAICINQADMSEVNKYVRRMWAIYEKARDVVVFLGEPTRGSSQALHLLFEISRLSSGDTTRHGQITKLLQDDRKAWQWNVLQHLMQRPWWGRAWIIQEYAVASRIVFLCGTARLGGHEFNQAMEYLLDYKYNAVVPQNRLWWVRRVASTPISHLLMIRRRYQLPGADSGRGPLDILYRSRSSEAADPRDKVYSLFRLISESPMLQPDYSRPVRDLYKNVVKVMIESSGTLEILGHHNRGIVGVPGLPSWCPDWTVPHGKRLLLWPKEYSAAGSSRAQARIHDDVLTVQGRILDRIQWLSCPFVTGHFASNKKLHAAIVDIKAAASRQAGLASQGNAEIFKAFWETIVTSRLLERERDGGWKPRILDSDAVEKMWNAWSSTLWQASHSLDGERRNLVKEFEDAVYSALCGRAFFVSQKGYLGVVDRAAQVGDVVVVALGGEILFALHETDCVLGTESAHAEGNTTNTHYHLVGECYMSGFMSGEGLASTADGNEMLHGIHLV